MVDAEQPACPWALWIANLVVDVSGSLAGAAVAGSSTLRVDSVRPRASARRDTLPVGAAADSLLIDARRLWRRLFLACLDRVFPIGGANKENRREWKCIRIPASLASRWHRYRIAC